MSAFIVDKSTIDNIVSVARDRGQRYNRPMFCLELDALGQQLWRENLNSVAFRYPDDTDGNRPGPCGFRDGDIDGYTFPLTHTVDTIQALKSIHCYEYQSCEHKGWEKSEAATICAQLQRYLITRLPGYEEAEWG